MRKFFIIFLTSVSFFLSYFSRIAWSIVSVYSSLKPTAVEDGIIFSLFFLGYIIVQIPAGIISDQKAYNSRYFIPFRVGYFLFHFWIFFLYF